MWRKICPKSFMKLATADGTAYFGCYDIQHKDTRDNDIQNNDTQD